MIEFTEDFDLILEGLWVFYHFFGDEFDDSIGMRRFFESGLVDNSVGSPAKDLTKLLGYLGAELVELADIFLSAFDEEIFLDDELICLHPNQNL